MGKPPCHPNFNKDNDFLQFQFILRIQEAPSLPSRVNLSCFTSISIWGGELLCFMFVYMFVILFVSMSLVLGNNSLHREANILYEKKILLFL